MTDTSLTPVLAYAIRLGDDALIMGHRLSEWISRGPFLEEDIALGNVALDFVGRARMLYSYAAELAGDDKTEDDFAYLRDERQFQNHLIYELPKGDFAYTMVRQLFVDVYNNLLLASLQKSADKQLAAIAAKSIKESNYHLRRSRDWVLRLGDGTEESHKRAQYAVDDLWGYTHEMFEQDDIEQALVKDGIAVDATTIRDEWKSQVSKVLLEATLTVPEDAWAVRGGREGYHTENLGHLLTEMQFVHRSYPASQW